MSAARLESFNVGSEPDLKVAENLTLPPSVPASAFNDTDVQKQSLNADVCPLAGLL